MSTQLIFAIPVQHLKPKVASLANEHTAIVDAIDVLITGV